jgi:hypothetical protein
VYILPLPNVFWRENVRLILTLLGTIATLVDLGLQHRRAYLTEIGTTLSIQKNWFVFLMENIISTLLE